MSPQRLIKKEARGRLKGHWGTALGVLCIPAAVYVAFAFIVEYIQFFAGIFDLTSTTQLMTSPAALWTLCGTSVLQVLSALFVLRPLLLGIRRWWYAMAFGNNTGARTCLYYFSRYEYGRCLAYTFRLLGHILLRALPITFVALALTALITWGICPELPAVLAGSAGTDVLYHVILVAVEVFAIAMLVGLVILVVLCLRFTLSDYLFVTERELNCIALSAQIMRGYKGHVFRWMLAFFGWALLGIFAIPLLFVLPYAGMAKAVLCKWIVYNYRNPPESAPLYDFTSSPEASPSAE